MRSSVGPRLAYVILNCPIVVRREKHFSRHHEEPDQHAGRDQWRHVTRQCKPPEQEQRADDVDDVIDVEAVPRSFLTAHASKRAVQAVAEPVDGQTNHDEPDGPRMGARRPEGEPGT
jgi:hypothetical protein